MKTQKHPKYTVFTKPKNESLSGFIAALEKEIPATHASDNVVADILCETDIKVPDLLNFLNISDAHRSGKHSFVILCDAVPALEIPDELMVTPTLEEAGDIIEMEEMERDLGF